MPYLLPLAKLADLLLVAAGILRAFSNSNPPKGIVSRESELAAWVEAISAEVAALKDKPH